MDGMRGRFVVLLKKQRRGSIVFGRRNGRRERVEVNRVGDGDDGRPRKQPAGVRGDGVRDGDGTMHPPAGEPQQSGGQRAGGEEVNSRECPCLA